MTSDGLTQKIESYSLKSSLYSLNGLMKHPQKHRDNWFREVIQNNPPLGAPDFDSYSRRGKSCILADSPLVATKNTGQKASRMGELFLVAAPMPAKAQSGSIKGFYLNSREPVCCLTATLLTVIHAFRRRGDEPVNTMRDLPARGAELISAFDPAGLRISENSNGSLTRPYPKTKHPIADCINAKASFQKTHFEKQRQYYALKPYLRTQPLGRGLSHHFERL